MSNDPAQPDNEFSQLIGKLIAAGAIAGAEERARQLAEAAGVELDYIKDIVLKASAGTAEPVTVTVRAGLASAVGSAGRVTAHGATATLTVSPVMQATALSGTGSLSVSREELEAAVEELSTAGPSDLEKIGSQSPDLWSRRELLANSALIVAVVYCFLLSSAAQQDLVNLSAILTALVTVMAWLQGNDN